MTKDEQSYIDSQIKSVKGDVVTAMDGIKELFSQQEKLLEERKIYQEREQKAQREMIQQVFTKTDRLEGSIERLKNAIENAASSLQGAVQPEDLKCDLHKAELENIKKNIGWQWSVIAILLVGILGVGYASINSSIQNASKIELFSQPKNHN